MKSETKTARFLMEDFWDYKGFPRVRRNREKAHRSERRVSRMVLKADISEIVSALDSFEI